MSSIRCTSLCTTNLIRWCGLRQLSFINCPKGKSYATSLHSNHNRKQQTLLQVLQCAESSEQNSRQIHRCLRMFLSASRNSNNSKDTDGPNSVLYVSSETTIAPGLHMTSSELIVKKSRFLGFTSHVSSWSNAQEIIDMVKKQHPKARHRCYGCRCLTYDQDDKNDLRNNDDNRELLSSTERSSDDGEPGGTGGLPILTAIRAENIQNVVCIVVRYYGGIQLGTGGLIRAYGAAARQVLRESPTVTTTPTISFYLSVPMQYIGSVYECIHKINNATSNSENYSTDGNVNLMITCNASDIDQMKRILSDSTRGTVQFLKAKPT